MAKIRIINLNITIPKQREQQIIITIEGGQTSSIPSKFYSGLRHCQRIWDICGGQVEMMEIIRDSQP